MGVYSVFWQNRKILFKKGLVFQLLFKINALNLIVLHNLTKIRQIRHD